jgi:predicted nucleic acid-binding protein
VAFIDSALDKAVSIVTLMEAFQGSRSKAETRTIRSLFHETGFRVLPLSEAIGERAAVLIEEHALSDRLHLEDALVAATAIEAGEVLATSNVRRFRAIRSLEVRAFRPHTHRSR